MIRLTSLLSFVALGVLLCAAPLSAQAPGATAGRKFAVLVGVEAYEHFNLRTPPLDYAVDDVTEMARILRDGGYQVTLLTDDTGERDESLAPTRVNIERQINAVLDACKRSDTVILAFAGHGVQFSGEKDAYFCPQDAKPFPDKTGTLVSMKKIYGELETSFAGVKLIFVDACRNDPDPGRGRSGLDSDSAPPPKGVGALFSCSAGQRAFEHKDLKHGVFFHYVLEGLRGEAQDRQGRVTFPGLAAYVQENVPGKVAELLDQREQLPNLRADLIGVPPVLLQATARTEIPRPFTGGSNNAAPRPPRLGSNLSPVPAPPAAPDDKKFPLTTPSPDFGEVPPPPRTGIPAPQPQVPPPPSLDDAPPAPAPFEAPPSEAPPAVPPPA